MILTFFMLFFLSSNFIFAVYNNFTALAPAPAPSCPTTACHVVHALYLSAYPTIPTAGCIALAAARAHAFVSGFFFAATRYSFRHF